MNEVQNYADNQSEIDSDFSGTDVPIEDTPTAQVFTTNSSAKFGDKIDVSNEVNLIPDLKLYSLPLVASQLIENKEAENAGLANPPILQRGLPTSPLLKRIVFFVIMFFILVILSVTLAEVLHGTGKSSGNNHIPYIKTWLNSSLK